MRPGAAAAARSDAGGVDRGAPGWQGSCTAAPAGGPHWRRQRPRRPRAGAARVFSCAFSVSGLHQGVLPVFMLAASTCGKASHAAGLMFVYQGFRAASGFVPVVRVCSRAGREQVQPWVSSSPKPSTTQMKTPLSSRTLDTRLT